MPDQHRNFAVSTVATAPSPATSGTSLVVASGHGSRFPAAPFNATVWPAGSAPDPSNAEIVRVTVVSTDTLTITRAQESTSARSITVGDQIAAGITAKTLTDAEAAASGLILGGSTAPSDATGSTGDFYRYDDGSTRVVFGPKAAATTKTLTFRSRTGGVATFTTSAAHGLAVNRPVTISGAGGTGYDGSYLVRRIVSSTVFDVVSGGDNEGSTASTGSVAIAWPSTAIPWRDIPDGVQAAASMSPYSNPRSDAYGWVVEQPYPSGYVGAAIPWPFLTGTAAYIVGASTPARWTGSGATGEAVAMFRTDSHFGLGIYAQANARSTVAGGRVGVTFHHYGSVAVSLGVIAYVENDGKLYVNDYGTLVYTSTNAIAASTAFTITVSVSGSNYRVDVPEISGASYTGTFGASSRVSMQTATGIYMKNNNTSGITVFQVTG